MATYGVDLGVVHGTAVRNRLAVRIAGSHPADRGSIPRYGSNHHGLQPDNGRQEIPVPKNLFVRSWPIDFIFVELQALPGACSFWQRQAPNLVLSLHLAHRRRQAAGSNQFLFREYQLARQSLVSSMLSEIIGNQTTLNRHCGFSAVFNLHVLLIKYLADHLPVLQDSDIFFLAA